MRIIRTPDAGTTDSTHSWLHPDGTTTQFTDEEEERHFPDTETTLG